MKNTSLLAALVLTSASCGSASQIIKQDFAAAPTLRDSSPASSSAEAWDDTRARIVRTFAFRALERNLVEEARGYLREACEMDPGDSECHAALARLFLAEGDARAALPYATQAVKANPTNAEAKLVLAAALSENKREQEATTHLEHVWSTTEPHVEVARALLTHHASLGGTAAARSFVNDLQKNNPLEAHTWAVSGDLDLAEGNLDAAAKNYRRALEIDSTLSAPSSLHAKLGISTPGKDPVWVSAQAAESRGDWPGAGRLFRFLVKNDSQDWQARAGLARSLWHENRTEEAAESLAQVPAINRTWRDYMLAAKIAISAKDWDEAQSNLLIALQLRPTLEAAQLLLKWTQEESKRRSTEEI